MSLLTKVYYKMLKTVKINKLVKFAKIYTLKFE